MAPDSFLLLYVFGGVVVLTLIRVARAFPAFGVILVIFLWVLGCAVAARRWDFDMRWVFAGSMGGVVLLVALLFLALWIADRWQDRP